MIKGKIPNIFYLIHLFLILILWILFFYLFFFNQRIINFNYKKIYFYVFEGIGFIIWSLGFFFLRKSSLSDKEEKMFHFAKKGDLFLISGFLISFLTSFIYGYKNFSFGIILGTLIILQTHFPLVEDESLYPDEIKNEDFN